MRKDNSLPYNDLPLLPPEVDIESREVLRRCIGSCTAVAELKQAGNLIPNQEVLINTIPLIEAQLSSEIENIVTTTDKLFQSASLDEESVDPATKEALRYRTALYQGYLGIREYPVSLRTAIRVCSTIKGYEMSVRPGPGTALARQPGGEIIYTPPVGKEVLNEKLANWEQFINLQRQIDPLIRMAVGHYQFEAIHPFTDGNGRTGRVLNLLLLLQESVLDIPVLYLSRYFLQHRSDYYARLRDVTESNAWQPWILFVLDAVEETARWTTGKIHAIRRLMEHTRDHVRSRLPGIYTHELVDQVFIHPYCRISNLVEAGLVKRQTASTHLNKLVDMGVLRETKIGREKLFIHPKFLTLLIGDENEFQEYA